MKRSAAVFGLLALATSAAHAQPPPSYDFQFVTVGAPGNPVYNDPTWHGLSSVNGRGSVAYQYRMSRLEVTTSQWMEFLNAFSGFASPNPFWRPYGPDHWGAQEDPGWTGPGERFRLRSVTSAGMLPCGGITWRMAALYCNWLTNGKGSSPAALAGGAYDTSTWGNYGTHYFTDAWTHSPGALFWIPTLDEQIKANHYDPNRYGPGQGGWWTYLNSSESVGTPGPPGSGNTSAGWQDPNLTWGEWNIPLGAYPQSLSPWGLLDTSGGAAEWDELVFNPGLPAERGYTTSWAGFTGLGIYESIQGISSADPQYGSSYVGLRIASTIPAPGTLAGCILFLVVFSRRVRKGGSHEAVHADSLVSAVGDGSAP
jgi:hypothetical protein